MGPIKSVRGENVNAAAKQEGQRDGWPSAFGAPFRAAGMRSS